MSDQVISIIGLVLVFAIATIFSVHMGALAIVAAFVVGTIFAGQSTDDLFGGFPGDLFVVLVGVTFLFAIAQNNGTVDWLVHKCLKAVGGRVAFIPWVMFLVTAILTAVGSVVPAAIGIIAPIGLGFAKRCGINPVLMGLLIINGGSAGGFSPISVFGTITNGVVERNDLPGNPTLLFLSSFVFNALLSIVAFVMFGGLRLLGRRVELAGAGADGDWQATDSSRPEADTPAVPKGGNSAPDSSPALGASGTAPAASATLAPEAGPGGRPAPAGGVVTLDRARTLTLIGLVGLVVGALVFDLDVGLMALTVTVVLALVSPESAKGAVNKCAWSTVLLVCGIVTYVSMMERIGTIDYLGKSVASINAPLLGAILICFIGAVVSAFASTTGILGALIPLAVPFLLGGEIGAVGLIIALALSSSIVDSSPFSTSGALVAANAPEEQRDHVFRRLMAWGMSMIVIIPVATWLVFVAPGWL